MKKKVFILTLFLFIFGTNVALAEDMVLEETVIDTVEEEVLVEEIEEITEEVEELLEEPEEIIEDEELEETIDEAVEEEIKEVLDEKEAVEEIEEIKNEVEVNSVTPEELGEKIESGIDKSRKIIDIIENQYNMKKQFVNNTKEAYRLSIEIENGLKNTGLEMKDIVKDEDRTIDKDAYGDIRIITGNIKQQIKGDNYKAGTLSKETVNYVRYVFNGQFRQANKTFKNMLALQEDQLALLREINDQIIALNEVLMYA